VKTQATAGIFVRLLICIFVFAFCLYSYTDKQNEVTELRICIPHVAKEIKTLKETNTRLQYEIDQFSSPEHLMELARRSEFSHLKFPLNKEVLLLDEGIALHPPVSATELTQLTSKPTLAVRH
jgi:hypothetical protein